MGICFQSQADSGTQKCFVKDENYKEGSVLTKLKARCMIPFLARCSQLMYTDAAQTGIPRPIGELSRQLPAKSILHVPSSSLESFYPPPVPREELFTKIPPTQHLLAIFYQDLKDAFNRRRSIPHHPDKIDSISIKPRSFQVWWGKEEPYYHNPRPGKVVVPAKEIPLSVLDHKGKLFDAVRIGYLFAYPAEGSGMYYCPDDDMVYYLPDEALDDNWRGRPYRVYPFGTFSEILAEFS
jgi:hypothetical protein